jgi:drug/metabolite transporter (DMT)-like permease
MHWVTLAVVAQFLNAFVALVDKRIVSDEKILPKPFVYAFYTCLISGVWIMVYFISLLPLPFDGLHLPRFENVLRPTLEVVALSFLAAYTFFTALVSMFIALKVADASDVVPVVGATSAVASFGLGYFFLHTPISNNFVLGIALLSVGTFLVSRFHFDAKVAFTALHAGIFFALHYVSIKGLFMVTSFDDGFFWSRIAFMFYALSLLMVPSFYEKIRVQTKATTKHAGFLIFSNKILAGVSTILILKATDMGDVAVVQALGGLQFVFILLLGVIFTMSPRKVPVGESYSKETILRKALFVAVITLGFLVLFT